MHDDRDKGGGRVLILVVERDPHVRKLERYFLESAGYAVEFADDGLLAFERARELLPDLLISEILVPKMDGLKVCAALKGDPATEDMKILIFSVLSAEDEAIGAGADAFLRKPLNDVLLVQTVEDLLASHRREHGASVEES